jgi:hypothetical protein
VIDAFEPPAGELHPQCVSFSKLNLRRRKRVAMRMAAVIPTIPSAVISCQSIRANIAAQALGAKPFYIASFGCGYHAAP